jgi:hypothetical protein
MGKGCLWLELSCARIAILEAVFRTRLNLAPCLLPKGAIGRPRALKVAILTPLDPECLGQPGVWAQGI